MPLVFQDEFHKCLSYKPTPEFVSAFGSIVVFNQNRNFNDIYIKKMEFMKLESCK